MASIVKLGSGKQPPRAIDFADPTDGGRRKRIRVGVVTHDEALEFKRHVEKLLAAKILNQTPNTETLLWLNGLPPLTYERLAARGLAPRRNIDPHGLRLRNFLEKYREQRRQEGLSEASLDKISKTSALLTAFFGEQTPIEQITPDAAKDWRASLYRGERKKHRSEATVRGHCRDAKKMFNDAVERELIARNPFAKLKSAAVSGTEDRYVTPEEAERILECCPNLQWRVLFGLARWAGLRCPSETHSLTWRDVDWERGRLTVYAPKTDQTRLVPIEPRLLVLLQDAFDAAQEGEARIVVTLPRNNRHRTFARIRHAAGVPSWRDLFQTLRRSCEMEWSAKYPQHAVSAWIGHSLEVSGRHYLRTTDHLLDLAAEKSAAESAAANPGNGHAKPRNSDAAKKRSTTARAATPSPRETLRPSARDREMRLSGLEPETYGLKVRCSTD